MKELLKRTIALILAFLPCVTINPLSVGDGPDHIPINLTYPDVKQTTSGGATWSFGYDDRGNRSSMTDPDAGTTAYIYDALGRETQRTDARGVAFVTTYDYLGRVTQRKADSETVTYSYGSSGNGQLKLASESYDGWTMSYTYDSLGRVTGETMSNGTITKSRSYTYGPDGMLATRTLPGGKTYSYSYDSYGNLTGVDAASGALRWDLTGYTGKRTTSTTVLGNSSYYTFNKATVLDQYGYLDSLIPDKNGIRYQDYDYGFSPLTGNLTYLDAGWMDYPHTFQYDGADRLTRVQENNQDILYMTYAQNGNILSKSGIGYYEYGSTQKPHAVTAVDNFDGWIDDSIQYISYNSWGKLEDLFSVRDGDVYHYSIEYGPDLQRVRSSLYRNGQPLYSKLYWDDYEEKTENNTTYLYWYVNGGEGLAGIMLGNAQNGSWSRNLVAITDHLGSIMALMDNYDTYYSCSYDAWGNRTIGMESPWGIDRGFCGHEHIEEIGLINMNGRMYDPLLGRFLSPDPYIQAPTDPQNFNRYSYCLNNPLKYTDPDGEYLHLIIGGIIGGITNWISHDCEFSWQGFWYFNVGALAGAASAAVGGGISSSLAGGSFLAGAAGTTSAMTAGSSFLHGVAIGGSSGFTSGLIAGTGNSIISGDKIGNAFLHGCKEGIIEGSVASFFGGVLGGIDAVMDGRRFWDGAIVENNIVDQSAFVTPSGQGGLRDCGPECVEIVDRSFGGNITAEDIRRQLGGDINDNALGDISTWNKYTEMSHHKYFAEISKTGRPSHIFSQMRDGWRVAVNLNTGYINPTTGLQEGHSIVMQKATQRIITHLNGMMHYKYIFNAVNPGYPGGSIERISMQQIKRAHNIFYIR